MGGLLGGAEGYVGPPLKLFGGGGGLAPTSYATRANIYNSDGISRCEKELYCQDSTCSVQDMIKLWLYSPAHTLEDMHKSFT